MYLPRNLIFEFLNQLSDGLPRFTIAFDYMSTKVIDGSSGVDSVTRAFDYFYERFTPFTTGFDDPAIFERNTPLQIVKSGSMDDFGARHSPRFAETLDPLAGLYNHCILSK